MAAPIVVCYLGMPNSESYKQPTIITASYETPFKLDKSDFIYRYSAYLCCQIISNMMMATDDVG